MCAQLCSLMKAQLLKTYEEVVFRFGGHFDMSLMQDCQVRGFTSSLAILKFLLHNHCFQLKSPLLVTPGAHFPQEEERVTLDEERAAVLDEERMLVEWAHMHSDNKENIPMFEDIVNENTSTPNSNEVVSLYSRIKDVSKLFSLM